MKSSDMVEPTKPAPEFPEQLSTDFELTSDQEVRRRLGWDMLEMERSYLAARKRSWNLPDFGKQAAGHPCYNEAWQMKH